MNKVFSYADALIRKPFHYCPGCTHGTIHRLIAEVIDELGIRERVVGISPVGCAVFILDYLRCDMFQASHGRAPAVATGAKRCRPDLVVSTYQGDGDLAAIGTSEIVHAANRGERITVFFVNNAVYGMTGGQMAPTSVPGQRTTTTPHGRNTETDGYPVNMSEMLAALHTPAYIARVSMHAPKEIIAARHVVKKAFEHQLAGRCFSFVEFLSTCPTNWGMTPVESLRWLEKEMLPYFPLGEIKVPPADDTGGRMP